VAAAPRVRRCALANQAFYWALLALAWRRVPMIVRAAAPGSGHRLVAAALWHRRLSQPDRDGLSGQSRFHYPAMPFLAIMAAWLIVRCCACVTAGRGCAKAPPWPAARHAHYHHPGVPGWDRPRA
jgi:hypothetical protein